ncbi:quinone-dependent dihydroorotate dehydrogenase [Synechococcales cyanobacterium C]|uniref:Dihydroorotate dehydrogenase (quinone) n=1 Tax=Petrachloros mirabilis ULC683 TaxID=2781853 RepID=A0A8K2A9P3_9CYAN|nr:quinone-dependent dihydroorotate dehydrogenase [Petrachloros mirabilis]NCJ08469.1 quinone-dependent dihydroorotate dehydrogenase [Petrachloros mirabilis ULC683]
MANLYKTMLQPLVFSGLQADPEAVHRQLLSGLGWMSRGCQGHRPAQCTPVPWLLNQWSRTYGWIDPRLEQQLWGLTFSNPVGLAAGFDKDGIATHVWPHFGFGFAEVGTVTAQAQPGNPRPRLFRLPQDQAAINRMGFNNRGAERMAQTLAAAQQHRPHAIPLGINLGKSKVTPVAEAAEDYRYSFQQLYAYGDYFVINVSSPNTPGLRSLQAVDQLEPILEALQTANQPRKPLLVKIAPDLNWEEIAAIVALAQTYALSGIIATNTTLSRQGLSTQHLSATGNSPQAEVGGLSGAPLAQRSTEVIRFIYQQTQGSLPIIGVGGIMGAEDAWEKLTAGASLLQVYTGWIYEGPSLVRQILQGLLARLQAEGFPHLQAAVGYRHPDAAKT